MHRINNASERSSTDGWMPDPSNQIQPRSSDSGAVPADLNPDTSSTYDSLPSSPKLCPSIDGSSRSHSSVAMEAMHDLVLMGAASQAKQEDSTDSISRREYRERMPRWQAWASGIVDHPDFEFTVAALVLANCISLSMLEPLKGDAYIGNRITSQIGAEPTFACAC
jgi:hypothetical protein